MDFIGHLPKTPRRFDSITVFVASETSDPPPRTTHHKLLWTELRRLPDVHPQPDGQTKRANRTIVTMLRAFGYQHPKPTIDDFSHSQSEALILAKAALAAA
ncbi:hypothetical protein BGZ90_007339 [Linnemannia elongata]|nr:hypothetical protein BGZ90_007339 [Linnemannia elongata]